MRALHIALAEEILSDTTKTLEDAKALARFVIRADQKMDQSEGETKPKRAIIKRRSAGIIKAANGATVRKAFANVGVGGYSVSELYDAVRNNGDPIPNDRSLGERMIARRLSQDKYLKLDNGCWTQRKPALVKSTG